MRDFTPDELLSAVDLLWGWMPAQQVKEIQSEEPDLYELCRDVHTKLWHS